MDTPIWSKSPAPQKNRYRGEYREDKRISFQACNGNILKKGLQLAGG